MKSIFLRRVDRNFNLRILDWFGKRACLFLIVMLYQMGSASVLSAQSWQNVLPGLAEAKVIRMDPTTPSILYAGLSNEFGIYPEGGVYKSSDGGQTWSSASNGIPANTSIDIYALAIDPKTTSTLYAGNFWFGGVYKSVDAGASWSLALSTNLSIRVDTIAIDPNTTSTVYAGMRSGGGMYKTIDGGNSWSALTTGLPFEATVYNIAIDPKTPSTVYAGLVSGIYKSTDGGNTWSAIGTGTLADATVNVVAVNPATSSTIYAGTDENLVFVSTDGGTTWNSASTGLPNGSVHDLAFDPITPSTMYAAMFELGGVYKSTDSGNTWNGMLTGLDDLEDHTLAIDPTNTAHLYVGTCNSGVFEFQPSMTVPSWPTNVTGTPGNAQVTVSWTAPENNGGSAITGYQVQLATAVNGPFSNATGCPANSTATTCTATGLTNGTTYYFQVAAINAVGTGPYSSVSVGVIPVPMISNTAATLAYNLSGDAGISVWVTGGTNTAANTAATSTGLMQEYHALIQQNGVGANAVTGQTASRIAPRVAPNSGSSDLGGVAIIGYRPNGILVTEAGIPASPQITSGRIYTEISSTLNTGIAMSNLTSSDATVNFYFTDNSGNDFDAGSMNLQSDHQTVAFLNQAPFNGPTGTTAFQGSFTFTSNVPIGIIALRTFVSERGEVLFTTLPVAQVGVSPNANVLPQFADGAGWTTSVFLTNASDSAETGTIRFFRPDSGAPNITLNGSSGTPFNYSIPAHSSARFDTSGLGSSLQVGSIVVTPVSAGGPFVSNDVPSAVSLIQLRQGGITISDTTFIASPTGNNFQLYMEVSGTIPQPSSVQSGLVIENPLVNAGTVTASISLYNMDGTSANLPPGGQISEFIDQLFPTMPASFKGIANLTTSAPVAVAALRGNYNERGDFLMTTTPPVNDVYPSPGNLVFPQVVNGGGFTTQIIVFGQNPGAGEVYLFSSDGVLEPNGTLQ